LLHDTCLQGQADGGLGERPVVRLFLLGDGVGGAAARGCGRDDPDAQEELAGGEAVLAAGVLFGGDEEVEDRDGARGVAGDLDGGVEGEQGGGEGAGVDDEAGAAAEDRVVFVLAGDGEAGVAALLEAHELGAAVVPAARALEEVAAEGGEVADAGGGGRAGGLAEDGVEVVAGGELGEGDEGAELEGALRVGVDGAEAGDVGEVAEFDELGGGVEALLDAVEEVDAAGAEAAGLGLLEHAFAGGAEGLGADEGEGVHGHPALRAARTRSGVRGRLRTGVPRALKTAPAIAAAVGIVAGSPMPMAPVLLAPVWTSVKTMSIAGMSLAPAIL
jgi:hypothetical protein